jgi:signal transduction histidine kinase
MENHRNQSRKTVKILAGSNGQSSFVSLGFSFFLALASIALVLSLLLPEWMASRSMDRGLTRLQGKKAHIIQKFQVILDEIKARQDFLKSRPIPADDRKVFALFGSIDMDPEKEGLALYRDSRLRIWRGNVFDVAKILSPGDGEFFRPPERNSLLIRRKASVYLVSSLPAGTDGYILSFRLLAFLPQFKTPYLYVYHFLPQRLLQNCNIDYWDFRDDISGYERIFSRYNDEYIGQPSPTNKRRTLIFPLRNSADNIIATVNLTSSPFAAKIAVNRQLFTLIFYSLLLLSLFSLLLHIWKFSKFWGRHKSLRLAAIEGLIFSARLLFFPISELDKIRSLSMFSPAQASFTALGRFSRSPADIFLTAVFAFLFFLFLAMQFRHYLERERRPQPGWTGVLASTASLILAFTALALGRAIVSRIALNSNLDLFRFSLEPTFVLLHLSILAYFLCFFILTYTGFRLASHVSGSILFFLPVYAAALLVYSLISKSGVLPLVLQGSLILLTGAAARYWPIFTDRKALIPLLLGLVLLTYQTVYTASIKKQQSILHNSLPNLIISHQKWGRYLIEQALPEIELEQDGMLTFFRTARPAGLAQSLWEKTLIAKFNWYSSLELLAPDGSILSRFSLNVPEVFRTDFELPLSPDWTVVSHNLAYLGKDNEFLIAYKDWMDAGINTGRSMLYLSMDYESLPFLYSANPYFEVLRSTSIPSLNQIDLGFAVFEKTGELYLNPSDIARGVPENILAEIQSTGLPQWGRFRDKNRLYTCLYYPHDSRIFALFVPVKRTMSHALDFMRLFFFQMCVIGLIYTALALYFQQKIRNPLWSFSNRVYIAFIAVALVPLLIYTVSTRSFFARIFSQHFTEKAEVHAGFAKRVMEDYILIQQEEQVSLTLPPDSVVLWISSTISNDVNLYRDGELISSSRRELFDSGILPDLIDGETYYRLLYENDLYATQNQRIGDYTFQTLTVPYQFPDSQVLISLPFPLEREELSQATEELIEFLFLLSVFFIMAVLLFARGVGEMIVRPIRKLLDGTKEVSLGNLEVSLDYSSNDEMKTLMDGFNTMVESLKKHQQEQADMSKKLAWTEMARKVAHEIKNPLTPIQLSAEHILKVYEDRRENFEEALRESASYIIKEVDNLRRTANEFMEISKESPLEMEVFDMKDLIQETIAPYKKVLAHRITFVEDYEEKAYSLSGDSGKLGVALRNLFTNAIEAIKKTGEIRIRLNLEKDSLVVEISDTGMGIPEDKLSKIFDLYYSTKEVGTGLGLPIAKRIIADHSGTISASSRVGKGTIITIRLPYDQNTSCLTYS